MSRFPFRKLNHPSRDEASARRPGQGTKAPRKHELGDSSRHNSTILLGTTIALLFSLASCNGQPAVSDSAAHRKEIEEWRQQRLTRLTSETGWLTLIGLEWLEEGENKCGSGQGNSVPLPADRAPEALGSFWKDGEQVRFEAANGVKVFADDTLITSVALRNDSHEAGPTMLRYETLRLYVIKRGDQLGIRIKDSQSKTRAEFKGLEYFPIDARWRVRAHFNRFETPKVVQVQALSGPPQTFSFPGVLAFTLEGKQLQLLAALEEGADGTLFLMFGDETNGVETYGAGRQLYTPLPDDSGNVVIDFNKAYNWPCVFTEFATCPIHPDENQLPIRVEAGEQTREH